MNVVRIQAQPFMQDLLEGCLVTLPLVLGANQQLCAAACVEADFSEFRLCRTCRLLDRICETDAAQHSSRARLLAPHRKPVMVRRGERHIHARWKVAAIVVTPQRILIRHRLSGNYVTPPQLERIDA